MGEHLARCRTLQRVLAKNAEHQVCARMVIQLRGPHTQRARVPHASSVAYLALVQKTRCSFPSQPIAGAGLHQPRQ